MKIFYTYLLLNPLKPGSYQYENLMLTHEPFYVGKGSKDRCEDHCKEWHLRSDCNKHKVHLIRKIQSHNLNPIIQIIDRESDEKSILNREIELIRMIGRNNLNQGSLVNLTDGGDGVSGKVLSLESRKKLSENNCWLGKIGKLHFASKTIYQYDGNGDFIRMWESICMAAKTFFKKGAQSNISACCQKRILSAYGYHWSFVFKGNKIEFTIPEKRKKGRAIILYSNNETLEFINITQAYKFFGLKRAGGIADALSGKYQFYKQYQVKYV